VRNTLSPHALNRLQRYHGRLEAAQTAMQQMDALARTYHDHYSDLLRAVCEEANIGLPREGMAATIHIDWKTGEVTWEPVQSPNGMVGPGMLYQQPEQGTGGIA